MSIQVLSSAFLKHSSANFMLECCMARSATRSQRAGLSARSLASSRSANCRASSNRCSGSVETANACGLKPWKLIMKLFKFISNQINKLDIQPKLITYSALCHTYLFFEEMGNPSFMFFGNSW